jgi:integrase
MLKLLVRVPLRQRNVRELRLEEHLYQEPHTGHWHLHFQGGALKIGTRSGRVNEYHINLTTDTDGLIPVLEEFLATHRPRLPGAATSPFLFLTHRGHPFSMRALGTELSGTVAMYTGQRFYPHLIRSIWATEYLERTQDFTTAAVLLGDTLKVVMDTYYDVVNKDHHAKAKAFLGTALQAG